MPERPDVRVNPRVVSVSIAMAALMVGLGASRWAGAPFTGTSLLNAAVAGVALGAIYSLAATGLVVTYTTSGIFNFAQGAIGMFMAFVFWQLTVGWGLPRLPALVLVVAVVAPLAGVALDRVAFARAAHSSLVVQIMATVALMVFLMGISAWIWSPQRIRQIRFFFGDDGFRVGETFVLWHRAITIALGVVIAIGLRLFLRRSRLGLSMRATVDNPTLSALHGARPTRASSVSWAFGCSLAALAGILIAPEISMTVEGLTLLIINAFAAAILGRLRSLPWTVAGGLLIGLLTSFTLSFLDVSGRWANVPQAIPTIVLFVALLALPTAPLVVGRRHTPLRTRTPTMWETALGGLVLVTVVGVLSTFVAETTVNRMTSALVIALILMPLVPLMGWAGQVSLAPLTFAGLGAFAMKQYATDGSWLGLLIGAMIAIPFGVAIALPALRLQGLYLSLATVAFARAMELMFFSQSDILGNIPEVVQRPTLFGIDLKDTRAFLVVVAVIFGLFMTCLIALRRSAFGRRLMAMRDSEAACTTVGIDVRRTKLAVFVLAAAIGAVGGGLLAMHRGTPTAPDFGMFAGIVLVLYLVMGGVGLVSGAIFSGAVHLLTTTITATWGGAFINALNRIAPGAIAGMMSKHPNGIAGQIGRDFSKLLPWRADARRDDAGARRPRPTADLTALGLTTGYSSDDLKQIDQVLGIPAELQETASR